MIDPTGATRNAFRDRALEGFNNITGEIDLQNYNGFFILIGVSNYIYAGLAEEQFKLDMVHFGSAYLKCSYI